MHQTNKRLILIGTVLEHQWGNETLKVCIKRDKGQISMLKKEQGNDLSVSPLSVESSNKGLREHSFFRRGGGAGGIPMSMNLKSPSPPFIFLLKNATLPQEAVKFIVTHVFAVPNLC